ncbi:MAG: UDP-N-acetylmuramoyl-L-alanyl-D-glutamate--2,6-diaminopimelate ligase [Clostridia bacterium]|nr:UDP-N-acetylmuramoyl-L-alanyl-D-glutamate--2,6-diaminopimelate ligase [Clostridia bacterium]
MRSDQLLRGLLPMQEIKRITERASDASSDTIFVCVRGARADGHDFASEAYERGCRIFVAERALELPSDARILTVPSTRQALAHLACTVYKNPSREMRVIGITGTKGKTTTAQLLRRILTESGIACGYIGTNGVLFGNVERELTNTTPDAMTLQRTLREMQEQGMQAAVLEVSSQALLQYRADGICFDSVLFTNLYPDHISPLEHPDLEHYIAAKRRLFTEFSAKHLLYSMDSPHAEEMVRGTSVPHRIACSSQDKHADLFADALSLWQRDGRLGISFTVHTENASALCELPLLGSMQVENALLAIASAMTSFDIPLDRACASLREASVKGRSECIPLPCGATAILDYAHNGESLRRLLSDLRAYQPRRLICLFGSVGERTQLRRSQLGEVAAELSDLCILTADNPGREDPMQIIFQISESFLGTQTPYFAVPDREQAIREAIRLCRRGDFLVLAGKGHESYQLIGNEKRPFCEREILLDAAEEALAEQA